MKTKAFHRSVGSWIGVAALAAAFLQKPSFLLLAGTFAVYMVIALTVTVGYHRLFTHSAFECNRFWQWTFGLIGSASLNSSPVQWAAVHIAHHKFSDSVYDPHEKSFWYFFRMRDRANIPIGRQLVPMIQDPMHKFFIDHSLTIHILFIVALLPLGTDVLLYLFVLPVGLYLITAGLHTIFAHSDSEAKDMPWLELFIPLAGEWIHKAHHKKPYSSNWGKFDIGGKLIELIKTRKRSTRTRSGR